MQGKFFTLFFALLLSTIAGHSRSVFAATDDVVGSGGSDEIKEQEKSLQGGGVGEARRRLIDAAQSGGVDTVRLILEQGRVSREEINQQLVEACQGQGAALIRGFLEYGADPNYLWEGEGPTACGPFHQPGYRSHADPHRVWCGPFDGVVGWGL